MKRKDDFYDFDDEESGYCSEEETEYGFSKENKTLLGAGSYAYALKFFPNKSDKKPIVVLAPKPFHPDDSQIVMAEASRKEAFFKTLYPGSKTRLFKNGKDDYRLVLPFIEGIPYQDLADYQFTKQGQIKILISAINTIIEAHENLVIMDLNLGNMLYNFSTGKTSLVDGGLSTRNQELIEGYQCEESQIKFKQWQNPQNPPECHSNKPVTADPSMDVYSLGYHMTKMFTYEGGVIDEQVKGLLDPCLASAEKRPNLIQLRRDLQNLLGSETDLKLNCNDVIKTEAKNKDFPYFESFLHPVSAAAWAGFATGLITGIIVTGLIAGSVFSFGVSLAIAIPLVLAVSPTIGALSGFLTGYFLEMESNTPAKEDTEILLNSL